MEKQCWLIPYISPPQKLAWAEHGGEPAAGHAVWSPAPGPVLPQRQEQLHAPALLEGAHSEPATGIVLFQFLLYLKSEQ